MTTATYRWVIIKGTLTTTSDLHIGTGETDSHQRPGVDQASQFNTVVLDHAGKPYIPGSTLRGLLASQLADGDWKKRWFGDARQRSDADTQGKMGALRVYDAKVNDGFACTFMSRTSIEPVTQTAKQHHLASHQLVQAGASFAVEIAFDYWGDGKNTPISRKDIEQLLGLLARLNGAQLGTGKSVGQGGLTWQQGKVKGLSEATFLQWLLDNLEQGGVEPKNLEDQYETIKGLVASTLEGVNDRGWVRQAFELKPLGPILINNPHDPALQGEEIGTPDLIFLHRGHKAWIPGSTLKGWCRAHCRRILLTIADDPHSKVTENAAEHLLQKLFGGTKEGESYLRFQDAEVIVKPERIHEQTFNAVDRFTGGVKDSALYNARSIYPEKSFNGTLFWRTVKQGQMGKACHMTAAMKLLLLFTLRDAVEGDLVLGWGKSKGYGRLELHADEFNTWEEIKNKLFEDEATITDSFAALQKLLNDGEMP